MSKITVSKTENLPKVSVPKIPSIVSSNRYDLQGGDIKVTYGSAGVDSKPYLYYSDSSLSRNFAGDEIRVIQENDVGTLVSVSIHMTVDTGSTSFTILIPRIKTADGQSVPTNIITIGVTTVHRFSVVPAFMMGQIDCYATVTLSGTASVETHVHANP
jgi:hypothetical protein